VHEAKKPTTNFKGMAKKKRKIEHQEGEKEGMECWKVNVQQRSVLWWGAF